MTAADRKKVQRLITAAQRNLSYAHGNKREFMLAGKAVAKLIAERLGMKAGEYELRWNEGGIAVSGDVGLFSDWIYIDFSKSFVDQGGSFMYRATAPRKVDQFDRRKRVRWDYTGGRNRWMKWEQLLDLDRAIEIFRECRAEADHLAARAA